MKLPFKSRLKEIIEPYKGRRHSTRVSLYTDLFIIYSIMISCLLIPLSYIFPRWEPFLWLLELFFTTIFSIEYLIRWYCSDNRIRYPFTIYAIIDFLSILPTLLLIHFDYIFVPIFRLFRLLRLLKFIRYYFLIYRSYIRFKIWFSAVSHHYRLGQLRLLMLISFFIWIWGANLLYFTETHFAGVAIGPYSNYWLSYWHIIIVLISGIEDKEPISWLGRAEVTGLLIAGICIVGMVTAEIVSILVRKMQRFGKVNLKPPKGKMKHHIVIIGRNKLLDNIVRQILAAIKGKHYILIVSKTAEELRVTDQTIYKKILALQGDVLNPKIIKACSLEYAVRTIILSTDDNGLNTPIDIDNHSLMETLAVLTRNPTIPITVELQTQESLKYASVVAGVDYIIGQGFGEKLICQAVLDPGVTAIYMSFMTLDDDSSEFYLIPVPEFLVEKSFKQAQLFFLNSDDEAMILVGIDRSPEDFPCSEFKLNPAAINHGLSLPDLILNEKDNLIIMSYTRPSILEVNRDDLWIGKTIFRS